MAARELTVLHRKFCALQLRSIGSDVRDRERRIARACGDRDVQFPAGARDGRVRPGAEGRPEARVLDVDTGEPPRVVNCGGVDEHSTRRVPGQGDLFLVDVEAAADVVHDREQLGLVLGGGPSLAIATRAHGDGDVRLSAALAF